MPKTRNQLRALEQTSPETFSKYFSSKISQHSEVSVKINESKGVPKEAEQVLAKTINESTFEKNVTIKKLSKKPPSGWEELYQKIKEYRKISIAPVDVMGCEKLAEKPGTNVTPQVIFLKSFFIHLINQK